MRYLFLILISASLLPMAAAAQPTEVKAVYRAGQTFVTWKESGAPSYRIYRSEKAGAKLADGDLVGTAAAGSSANKLEAQRNFPLASLTGIATYGTRYVIEDNPTGDASKMLSADTGLFVQTVKKAGNAHYTVIAVGADGKPEGGAGKAQTVAVAEKVEPIGAVLLFKQDSEGGDVRFYQHWMDPADWNPAMDGGYGYIFSVGVPKGEIKGLVMRLHGYSGGYEKADLGFAAGFVTILPMDATNSWFYGFRDASGAKVVNYTERRIMSMVETVPRMLATEGVKVPSTKTYIFGGSMGGTGANFLGAWHGDVFAAVLASKGAVDHSRNGKWTADSEQRLWGTRAENLPTNAGDKVWDHLNLIKWHREHPEVETTFFLDAHASNDESVPYDALPEYYAALQDARRPFAAKWGPYGHSGFEEPRFPNHKWWGMFSFNLDESVPAISHASSNDDPATATGQINCKIEWSARENDFETGNAKDDVLDQPKRWEICLRSLAGAQTADITPRRCQQFKVKPGTKCAWENWSCADKNNPQKIAEGTVEADKYGLVTIAKFAFDQGGWGNRLVIIAP